MFIAKEENNTEIELGPLTPENIVNRMLETRKNWEAVKRLCMIILSAKRKEMNKQN